MAFVERCLLIKGSRVLYRDAGVGKTLLFLHGAGGADSVLPFLQSLLPDYRLLVPDHPGFGRSDDPAWLADMHDLAFAYLDFLDTLDLRQVHIVATSLGGWLAMELAIRSCVRLASVTLIAPAGVDPGQIPLGDLFAWSPEQRVRNLVADPGLADKILSRPLTAEQQQVAARNWRSTSKLAGEPRWVNRQLPTWLHRINVPTQILWGEQDRLFPPACGHQLAGYLPQAQLKMISHCGHLPQVEQPDQLRQLIRDFVR